MEDLINYIIDQYEYYVKKYKKMTFIKNRYEYLKIKAMYDELSILKEYIKNNKDIPKVLRYRKIHCENMMIGKYTPSDMLIDYNTRYNYIAKLQNYINEQN